MWIKLVITIITFLLLFNESFKVLEKFKKKYKRIVLVISLSILFILSVVDVINEVNESNDLIQKADTIIHQSDTLILKSNAIISSVEENIKSLQETGESIVKIDNVLKSVRDSVSNQVEMLKTSVNKSKELVKLEELKFQQDEAKIKFYSEKISFTKKQNDSAQFILKYYFLNKGKRTAAKLKLTRLMFYYENSKDILHMVNLSKVNSSILTTEMVSGDLANEEFSLTKHSGFNDSDVLILILNADYDDKITNIRIKNTEYFIAKKLKRDSINFNELTDRFFANKLNKKLIKSNLQKYLMDLNKL